MGAGGGMVNLVSVGRLYIDRASRKIGQVLNQET